MIQLSTPKMTVWSYFLWNMFMWLPKKWPEMVVKWATHTVVAFICTQSIPPSVILTCFHVKFIYSEKAKKFCEISTLLLTVCTVVKSKVEISQNFVAFSEYMNFNIYLTQFQVTTSNNNRNKNNNKNKLMRQLADFILTA